jgi:hypothetical protein
MISHPYKFIFFHIPKTAGTSIEKFLYPFASESCGGKWAVSNRCWRNRELFEAAQDRRDYFAFAIVRNPLDRFISAWNQFHRMENGASVDEFLSMTEMFLAQMTWSSISLQPS